jgi:hypothetical protein
MFEKSGFATTPKNEVLVTLSLMSDEYFEAWVFLRPDERLLDLLNDPRPFIPVRRLDGATMIISKSNIISIIEKKDQADEQKASARAAETPRLEGSTERDPRAEFAEELDGAADAAKMRRASRFDPYKILRISMDATIEEIRRAYKSRIKAVHPDTLAGLDVDDEISNAALLATQKVTLAYQRILKERRASETSGATEGDEAA